MRARRSTVAEGRARVELLNRMVLRLVDFPRPTVAMVDGYAVGAGTNLALCCDLVVASDRAKFGELFNKIGLVPDGGGTWLLSRLVGLARAKELIFTGDVFDAAEAERIGLVNRVVPAADLSKVTWAPGSIWRPTRRACPSPPTTIRKASRRSSTSAHRDSPGADELTWFRGSDRAPGPPTEGLC